MFESCVEIYFRRPRPHICTHSASNVEFILLGFSSLGFAAALLGDGVSVEETRACLCRGIVLSNLESSELCRGIVLGNLESEGDGVSVEETRACLY